MVAPWASMTQTQVGPSGCGGCESVGALGLRDANQRQRCSATMLCDCVRLMQTIVSSEMWQKGTTQEVCRSMGCSRFADVLDHRLGNTVWAWKPAAFVLLDLISTGQAPRLAKAGVKTLAAISNRANG
jgi:hypothetical protein